MRTTFMAKASEVERKWYVIDAEGKTLGRLSTEVASILRGKHKPTFTPNVDTGDHVIIINVEKIHLTGKKLTDKIYYRHTMHPGGLKQELLLRCVQTTQRECLSLLSKVCFQRILLDVKYLKNYTYMLVASIHMLHNNLKYTNYADNY